MVGGGERGVVFNQLLNHRFFVYCGGGGEFVKLSFKGLHAHLVSAVVCFHFALVLNPCGRIRRARLVGAFCGLRFYSRFGVRSLVDRLPAGLCFIGLSPIFPVVVRSWV